MSHPLLRSSARFRVAAGLALAVGGIGEARAASLSAIGAVFDLAAQKYTAYYNSISTKNKQNLGNPNSPPSVFPAYTTPGTGSDGWSTKADASDWRAGFTAGIFWEIYGEDGGSSSIKTMAQNFTFGVRNNVAVGDHDVGFRTLPSYGLGAQLIGGNTTYTYQGVTDASYNSQIEAAADHLASRYIPAVGATRSWDKDSPSQTDVIADNMMNLQILFQGAQVGDTTTVDGLSLTQIAINHARTTFNDFVRADGSSVHEVVFNTSTGAIMYKQSVQGITSFGQDVPGVPNQPYATEGTWSRGQSWLINGFTMMYTETKMPEFLADAQTVANYWVKRTLQNVAAGQSYVPPTDFDVALVGVPDDVNHQDSSAAAIAADGLLQLAAYTTDPTLKAQYWSVAVGTLNDLLSSTYFSSDPAYGALLMHGANQFSVAGENSSLVYGDYYLLDALDRYQALAPSIGVPEPASLSLLGAASVAMLLRRRRSAA